MTERRAGRAHQPRLRRDVPRPSTSSAWTAHRRLRPRPERGQDRDPARPRGSQGLDEAAMGRHGRTAFDEGGNWPVIGPSADPLLGTRATCPEGDDARGHGPRRGRSSRPRATKMADRGWASTWLEVHAAHGYLLSAFITPLSEPARPTITAAALDNGGCGFRSRSSAACRDAVAGRQASLGSYLRNRLGSTAGST